MTLSNEAVYDEPTDSLMTTLSAANDTTFVEPETRKLPPIPVVHDDKDSVTVSYTHLTLPTNREV